MKIFHEKKTTESVIKCMCDGLAHSKHVKLCNVISYSVETIAFMHSVLKSIGERLYVHGEALLVAR